MIMTQTSGTVIGKYPLSAQQRRVWLEQSDQNVFRAQCAIFIDGSLNCRLLEAAIPLVIERHEILRTTFQTLPGLKLPSQTIHEFVEMDWQDQQATDLTSGELRSQLRRMMRQQAALPFDLEFGPLLRVLLLNVKPERHLLVLTLPALCADSVTLKNLVQEIGRAYASIAHGEEMPGEPLAYAEFSVWQAGLHSEEEEAEAKRGKAFWARQRSFTVSSLPSQGINESQSDNHEPHVRFFEFDAETTSALDALARQLEVSPRVVLLAGWQALTWRLTSAVNQTIGEVFDGRIYEDFREGMGLYARLLPMSVDIQGQQRFSSLAQQTQELRDKLIEWEEYADFGAPDEFPIGFEYDEWQVSTHAGLCFTLAEQHVWLEKFQAKLTCVRASGLLRAEFYLDAGLSSASDLYGLEERYEVLLKAALKNPETTIQALPILSARERRQVLSDCNDSDTFCTPFKAVHQLFEEEAELNPTALAVICGEQRLTYNELNRRANQVAHHLLACGLKVEQRVGLFFERSADLLVGLLAILKAGGAYVPLDLASPKDRIGKQLIDANVRMILMDKRLVHAFPSETEARPIFLDEEEIALCSVENPSCQINDSNLVYVLFTSGSTGRPKGVAVEHRQLFNYMQAVRLRLDLPRDASFALVSTFAADLGNTMIYSALCTGGCLHIISEETATDPAAFGEYLQSQGVDCLKIVPSHLSALLLAGRPQDLLPRSLLVLGGEATPWGLVEKVREVAPQCRIVNHYGPTETTVGVITLELDRPPPDYIAASLPLGHSLANCKVYLLDANLEPVPFGLSGEICIGGAGLARGYIGQPHITAEKFIPNPLSQNPGERLYRTGDRGRFLPDGTIEFQGRIDNQVKIRGYRVELGEIEATLRSHAQVWESVVVARENHLVAYVVPQRGLHLSQSDLREFLADKLPEYMHPSSIVLLDKLPLTPNGKVDRAALPAPEHAHRQSGVQIVEPRTPEEKALAAIWGEVLNVPKIGIDDNFFELGGDSILAIQAVARANRIGLRLTPKQIFDNQTIARLALVAGSDVEIQAEQGLVTGPVPLTPIQHWFFEQNLPEPHHWNQGLLLELSPEIKPSLLEEAVSHLLTHHDALRLRFKNNGQNWEQRIAGARGVAESFVRFDFSKLPEEQRWAAVEQASGKLQASLDLADGPIVRFAFFDLGGKSPNRLAIMVHHLAVDGVSWRVLVEDLQTACTQLSLGEPVALPPKTSSFRQWSEHLIAHAVLGQLVEELPVWLQPATISPTYLERDGGGGDNSFASATSIETSLNVAETQALLQEMPEAYGTQINDILLTAITCGFAFVTGSSSLFIELEGHGREELFDDLDISRTIGWFTTHYPVLLDISGAGSVLGALKLVKEQLRAIPNKGIGYGLLRYLGVDLEVADTLSALPHPEIKFNYLGQFDQSFINSGSFVVAGEAPGAARSVLAQRYHLLDINGFVAAGKLYLKWTYSRNIYDQSRIQELAEAVLRELRGFLACESPDEFDRYTPSDFSLARLDDGQLKKVLLSIAPSLSKTGNGNEAGRRRIEDIYPVSPLQESLLFQRLSSPGSGAGFEQKGIALSGDIDLAAFDMTWQEVVNRHPMLRTAFVTDGMDESLQVVVRQAHMPIEHHDWRQVPASDQREKLESFMRADRDRGFDPVSAPLMRLAMIRLNDEAYHLVWSYDHLLLDAWCRNLLLQEVFELYRAYRDGEEAKLPRRPLYRDYIAWLQRQDVASAEQFWRETLEGLHNPTSLPVVPPPSSRNTPSGIYKTWMLKLTGDESALIASSVRRNKLTLNTLVHGAWALLLSRYCRTSDVLFGTTVSGRPTEVPEVESILGMFINNLPIRVRLSSAEKVLSMLTDLQTSLARLREYEWVSPLKFQEWSEVGQGQRLFESLLIIQNYPTDDASLEVETGIQMLETHSRLETAYPLTVVVGPFEPLTIRIFYDTKQFDDTTIGRIAGHLRTLLNGLAVNPDVCIRDIPMLTAEEQGQLLLKRTNAGPEATKPAAVHALIEDKADFSPDEVAVKWRQESLTWAELNRRIAGVALKLAAGGIEPGAVVAIMPERRLEFPVSLMAILKLGASYVVRDPSTSRPEDKASAFLPDVMAAQARSFTTLVKPTPRDIFVASASTLEALASELIRALGSGTPVIIPDAEIVSQPLRLRDFLENSGATIMQASPHTWKLLLETGWQGRSDFKAIVAGKALPAWVARELSSRVESLLKIYKADELELWLAGCRFAGEDIPDNPGLIGAPVDGCKVSILSDDLEPVPVGITGEVCIGFDAGWSYTGNPVETAQRFLPSPFGEETGARFYRTCDLARWRDDGRIEFRGEVGKRIAINGQIVDLSELEIELLKIPVLREVALKKWEDALGDSHLVAYFVADQQSLPGVEELLKLVRQTLSRRTIPDLFVRLDSLPVAPNGNVDHEALPSPDEVGTRLEIPYVVPCDELQLRLKQIWEALFGIRPIEITDNFFDLGGHSLLAVRMMIEIRKEFGRELPLSTLLQMGTIERLADVLRSTLEPESWSPLVGLQTAGSRLPLFCVHGMGGEVLCYSELSRCLGPDQPFYALQSESWLSDEASDWRLEEMAAHYVEALREVQPEGPYCIAGWSFGGLVALEMAQQLYAAGEPIALLGILDTNLEAHLDAREGKNPDQAEEEALTGWDSAEIIMRFARRNCSVSVDQLRQQGSLEQQLAYAIEYGVLPPGLDIQTGLRYARAGMSNTRAKNMYVPQPYPGKVTLFRAKRGHILNSSDATLGWKRIALGGIEVRDIAGEHNVIVDHPYVQTLARELGDCMDQVQATALTAKV